ncbi:MAG: serine/threonine protein kinase, partial [Lentisphaeria bacterium]|nr:serine/threonine protein kinase [Lentisphaeria bacterium]
MDDLTIPPRRMHEEFSADVTMPGRRDRKQDGKFEPGDLILGRYNVIALLGQGGMGVVYKCFDEIAGIEIALKALPPELSNNTLEMEDIKDNFQLVHNLHHPNISASNNLERDNSNGNYYLIMECVEGEDLRRWIRRRRQAGEFSLDKTLAIIKQVASALDYAHQQRVMHRDINPGHIMISADGSVKVLDFGLAAQIHTSMTRVSMAYHGTSGTGPYMAPEQWRGRPQGAAADQYALAVMTYEMLAGFLPFDSTDAAVLQQAVLTQKADEVSNIPKYAQNALKRAMSKDPSERFENCSDFVAALNGKKIKPAIGRKNNRPWLMIGVIVLLLLGAGGTGFWFVDKQKKEQQAKIAAEQL